MIKGSIHQEDITILDVYVQTDSTHMKQKLTELQGETDKSTIIVKDFNNPLSIIDRTSKQNINKDIEDLNNYQPT